MKRTPLKRGTSQMKRTELNPTSTKRTAENRERSRVMVDLFGSQEDWRCSVEGSLDHGIMGPCYGPIHGHEILTRGRGGSITDPANIVLLCDRHNEWASSHPEDAHRLGLVRHSWER